VNIRTPRIPGGGEVRLEPGEKAGETLAWYGNMTLEFTNSRPTLRSRYQPDMMWFDMHGGGRSRDPL
jgi:hypothetical protein